MGATVLGEQVIEHARAMLARLDAIRALADDSRGLHGGRIRLGSFPSVFSTLLPGLLRDFQRRHPGIELVALEGTDEEVEDWLAAGTVELGVVLNPAPGRRRRSWDGMPGSRCCLPAIRWAAVPARAVSRWRSWPRSPSSWPRADARERAKPDRHERAWHLSDIRVTVRDWASACALVREGMGVSLVPESDLAR